MRRICAFCLAVILLSSLCGTANACNESQSDTYVMQILFGNNALSKETDENAKLLMYALYLCCEQADNQGQMQINFLKRHRVSGIPALENINIRGNCLIECSHNSWEQEYTANAKAQRNRKNILQNSVNKVFDFGILNNLFGSSSGKCNSFAALLYYSHILSDYLASDPSTTVASVKGKNVSSFSGEPYCIVNGNRPSFTLNQISSNETFSSFSPLDAYGRAGVAFANIGPEMLPPPNPRQQIGYINPSGWSQVKYPGIVNSSPAYLFNRCHLIAHQLSGEDGYNNLITGTRYLNENGMKPFEEMVTNYIRESGNHVLYRATPIYIRDNSVASGVQLEAYSVEDAGKGISFNVYCYNIQPGIELNYTNGSSTVSDMLFENDSALPFVTNNPSEENPDLVFEMKKHLAILFDEPSTKSTFDAMISQIDTIANEARSVGSRGESPAICYMKLNKLQFQLFETLKSYVPLLLQKQEFFCSAF